MTAEQALKLAFELIAAAFKVADAFGQRKALKAKLRAEMGEMFDAAEAAIEAKHRGTDGTE